MLKLETHERCKTGKSEGKQNGGVWHSTTAHFPAFVRTAEHLTEETSSVGSYAVACLLDKDHQQKYSLAFGRSQLCLFEGYFITYRISFRKMVR
jgi:hypothetical protein